MKRTGEGVLCKGVLFGRCCCCGGTSQVLIVDCRYFTVMDAAFAGYLYARTAYCLALATLRSIDL
jgi:hypothetical protein